MVRFSQYLPDPAFIACIGLLGSYILYFAVDFLEILKLSFPQISSLDCYEISGIRYGANDFHIIRELNVAIVSSGWLHKYPSNIFLVNLTKFERAQPFKFKPDTFDKSKFHPHGLSLLKTSDSDYQLYVVNHHDDYESIEIFQLSLPSLSLEHLKTVKSSLFQNLSDVAAVGEFKFYATNWLPGVSKMSNQINLFPLRDNGDVVYADGEDVRVVLKDLFMPNGLATSDDGLYVYIGIGGRKKIEVYSRNLENNSLQLLNKRETFSFVDKLTFVRHTDGSASLWFAGPYRLYDWVVRALAHDVERQVAGYVRKVDIEPDGTLGELSDISFDDGSHVSGHSKAAPYGDRFLLGTIDSGLFVCQE